MRVEKFWIRQAIFGTAALAMACAVPAAGETSASEGAPAMPAPGQQAFMPAVTLVPEVVTSSGAPRMYPVGGGQETVWQPGMPVYIGDTVRLNTFVSTGDASLREVRVRMDNEAIRSLTTAPWVAEIDTSGLTPGYHFVEVFADSADPNAPSGSATLVLFVRQLPPPVALGPTEREEVTTGSTQETVTEPITAVAGAREAPDTEATPPAHPGQEVPVVNGVPQYPAALAVTIHSRDAAVEQRVRAGEVARVSAPVLFHVTPSTQRAQRFVYVLTRQGREIFRSEPLPINALVRLQPKMNADAVGLLPGELSLWVWASDGSNLYGAPARVRVEIVPPAS